ncbi:MAG: hypothetical protein ACK55I_22115, partial [bacterium]
MAAIVNFVDCLNVSHCAALNRENCGGNVDRQISCGPCLPDFFGEDGAANSLCLPFPIQINSRPYSKEALHNFSEYRCNITMDCGFEWLKCDTSLCVPVDKERKR